MQKNFIICFYILLNSISSFAFIQTDSIIRPQPRSSQIVISSLMTPNCYMKATYGQPLKRNRVVFGGLVPYNKLWRTGANEATEITFTNDLVFGGKDLKAGTYTLFTEPSENEWKVILNSVLGQWGETAYDSSKNVLELTIASTKNDLIYEGFTISFKNEDNLTYFDLLWDNVKVNIPITFNEIIIPTKKKKKKKIFNF